MLFKFFERSCLFLDCCSKKKRFSLFFNFQSKWHFRFLKIFPKSSVRQEKFLGAVARANINCHRKGLDDPYLWDWESKYPDKIRAKSRRAQSFFTARSLDESLQNSIHLRERPNQLLINYGNGNSFEIEPSWIWGEKEGDNPSNSPRKAKLDSVGCEEKILYHTNIFQQKFCEIEKREYLITYVLPQFITANCYFRKNENTFMLHVHAYFIEFWENIGNSIIIWHFSTTYLAIILVIIFIKK